VPSGTTCGRCAWPSTATAATALGRSHDASRNQASRQANDWQRGLPSFAPITTCHRGTICWVTDLDSTYNASSDQNLRASAANTTEAPAPPDAVPASALHPAARALPGM
jgi:hypothetical protein